MGRDNAPQDRQKKQLARKLERRASYRRATCRKTGRIFLGTYRPTAVHRHSRTGHVADDPEKLTGSCNYAAGSLFKPLQCAP